MEFKTSIQDNKIKDKVKHLILLRMFTQTENTDIYLQLNI